MQQQALQQLIDQQSLEKQKQLSELMHANKGVEALGALVQYLVFNVSIFVTTLEEVSDQDLEIFLRWTLQVS